MGGPVEREGARHAGAPRAFHRSVLLVVAGQECQSDVALRLWPKGHAEARLQRITSTALDFAQTTDYVRYEITFCRSPAAPSRRHAPKKIAHSGVKVMGDRPSSRIYALAHDHSLRGLPSVRCYRSDFHWVFSSLPVWGFAPKVALAPKIEI